MVVLVPFGSMFHLTTPLSLLTKGVHILSYFIINIKNMSHLITPMSILTKKVHFWSYLIKCHSDQVVKNVILIK
jgi:hypothetical protein